MNGGNGRMNGLSTDQTCILIVDDDTNFRLLARRALDQMGYQSLEASNGLEMLQLFQEETVHLILLDIKMPVLDGLEACRRLRSMPEGRLIPVLMLTGLDDIESIKAAYEAGATDFTSKPVNWLVLGHRVQFLLRGASQINTAIQTELASLAELYDLPELAIADDEGELDLKHVEMLKAVHTLQNIVGEELFNQYFSEFLTDIDVLIDEARLALSEGKYIRARDKISQLKVKFGTLNAYALERACSEALEMDLEKCRYEIEGLLVEAERDFESVKRIVRRHILITC